MNRPGCFKLLYIEANCWNDVLNLSLKEKEVYHQLSYELEYTKDI